MEVRSYKFIRYPEIRRSGTGRSGYREIRDWEIRRSGDPGQKDDTFFRFMDMAREPSTNA